ncbi:MAG: hypothetical protein PVI57_12440 [Gemmatimonadota bacterium]|jgi:hypothetical protein
MERIAVRRTITAGFCLLAVVLAVCTIFPDVLLAPAIAALPDWQNLHLLTAALALACAGCAFVAHGGSSERNPFAIPLYLALLTSCSLTVVLLFKYVSGMIPDTWSTSIVSLYGVLGESLVDLYAMSSVEELPLTTPIYPPGYYILLRPLVRVLGDAFSAARILSFVSILAMAIGMALIGRSLRRKKWFIAPAVFLSLFPVLTWSGPPTKPEFLAAALAVLALAAYLHWGFARDRRWIWPVGGLFGAALLVKYTVAATFGAVLVHLVVRRRWREAIAVTTVAVGVFMTVYGVLSIPTSGGIWHFTVFANAVDPLPMKVVSFGLLEVVPRAFTAFVLAVSVVTLATGGAAVAREGAIAIAPLGALGLFLLATGRPGSSPNYFLEFVVAGSVLLGLLPLTGPDDQGEAQTAEPPRDTWGVRLSSALLLLLVLTQLPSQAALLARSYGHADELRSSTVRALTALPVDEDQFVLSDSEYASDLRAAGQVPLVYDAFQFTLMYENGTASVEPLMAALADDKVPYVVLADHPGAYLSAPYGSRGLPLEVASYVGAHYDCAEHLKQWDGIPLVICARTQGS